MHPGMGQGRCPDRSNGISHHPFQRPGEHQQRANSRRRGGAQHQHEGMNENIDQVIPEFVDLVADIEIELRLAQRDPQGNCHSGISQVVSELTYVGDSEMKQLIQWPRNKYLNVWVCEDAEVPLDTPCIRSGSLEHR